MHLYETRVYGKKWPTGGKANLDGAGHAKGTNIVNRLRHSYLNVMKLENYSPTGECLKNNH
jgi:hypothetical protein